VFTVVAELVAAQRSRTVVLLADRDKAEMERALAARLGTAGRGRIVCRSGPASDPAVLALVSPGTARTVLVLPSGGATGDAEVLRVLLALRTVLGEGAAGPPVLAAVRDARFRSSALSRPESLLGLDLTPYDTVLVLGPDPGTGPDRPDDWTLVTLLGLRLLEQRAGHDVRVVTELTDDRNRALAPLSPGSDVVVSGEPTGLLMAQIAHNPQLAAVFDELFSAKGSGICLRPAGHYVRVGRTATFATVVAAARDLGECAIGYRSRDRWSSSPDHGVRLNPHKGERREWGPEDQVVVVAAESVPPARHADRPRDAAAQATAAQDIATRSNSRTSQTT
jgi:voltage-gated potassium channel Kch